MPIRLTETAIAKAVREAAERGKRQELADAAEPGLRLRIMPPSRRSTESRRQWVLACRDQAGRMRRFGLGEHPEKGIKDARELARQMRHRVKHEGADPIAQKRRARAGAAACKAATLGQVIGLYAQQRGAQLRSWPEYTASIRRLWGNLLNRPVDAVSLGELQLAADSYSARQQAALAVRCLRPILKWAAAPGRRYVAAELTSLMPPASPKRRERVLSRAELARLLPVLRTSSSPYAAALEFLLLTLGRREEIAGARWRDVDWEVRTVTIAAERSKNRQPHVIPLSRQAIALLRARAGDGTVDPDRLIFGPLSHWDRETKRIQETSSTKDWHRHDLRRTGATMLGEMGELPDIVEAALNHTSIRSRLAATYNKARYRPQVALALQRLADALDGIEAGGGEVVPLRG